MSTSTPPRWIIGGASRPAAPKLYCFAHGGGSAAEYLRWARDLKAGEPHAVQLPGRGSRTGEPVITSMDALVAALLDGVRPDAGPFVFFGHSFGSLVAFEFTRALRAAGRPQPAHLVVSGYPAPHLPRAASRLHLLGDRELLEEVSGLHGGIPPEVMADDDLVAIAARALRADYQVLETYAHRPEPPLSVPVTVLGGTEDRVTAEQLEAWRELTDAEVTVRRFPGGHFYLRDRPAPVLRALSGALTAAARATAGVPAGSGERGDPC
ncbi:thioesterase II family protein [Streptomyces roseicoloratus]|uniref:thioesterase II family protein n=1 Tax=Streptomyces roseicoloratus TaxID=2508722 RepID=UPI001009A84B|nr:alpha/beta fold hydrolase [Streptomyces roseicoloratus]